MKGLKSESAIIASLRSASIRTSTTPYPYLNKNPKDDDDEQTQGYKSICDETFNGWAFNKITQTWQCYSAVKKEKVVQESVSVLKSERSSEDPGRAHENSVKRRHEPVAECQY